MKKILVPTDFSETSLQAFRFAIQIARGSQGEIHLLHTVELPVLFDSGAILAFEEAYMTEMRLKSEKKMEKIVDKLADGFARVKYHVQFGKLQLNIHRLVESAKIDLIVAGTNGAKGLREFTIGSNAEKLVRNAEVPVIVVRKAPKEIKNIVFPTLPDMDQEDLTMRVKSLQDFFKAKLHILYVNTPATFVTTAAIDTMFTKFAKRFMLKNYDFHVYNELTTEAGIINFAKSIKADMVVMRTHGRKGFAHLGSGSIAEDVVNHIDCPVTTFRIK
jgi:nucleotide-binding universal stress UspA family protein